MIDQQMIAEMAAQAEQADWDNDVQSALTRPTVSSLVELTTHPHRMEAVGEALGKYSDARAHNNLTAAVSIGSALNAGKTEIALKLLHYRRAAHRRAGENRQTPPTANYQNVDGSAAPGWDAELAKSQVHRGDNIPNTTEVTDALIGHIRSEDPTRLEMAKGIAGMIVTMSLDQSNPRKIGDALARMGFEDDRPAEDEEKDA